MELVLLIIQAISAVSVLATLLVYGAILREMQKQRLDQNFLTLSMYLNHPRNRRARRAILTTKEQVVLGNMVNEKLRHAAEEVCASYNLAGVFVRMGLVRESDFVPENADSIEDCYKQCAPLIELYQRERGDQFWAAFKKQLYDKIPDELRRKNPNKVSEHSPSKDAKPPCA